MNLSYNYLSYTKRQAEKIKNKWEINKNHILQKFWVAIFLNGAIILKKHIIGWKIGLKERKTKMKEMLLGLCTYFFYYSWGFYFMSAGYFWCAKLKRDNLVNPFEAAYSM